MTPAKKTTTSSDGGEKKKEYKYQQEISQMVRTPDAKAGSSVSSTDSGYFPQMFVFGEIQEPLTETVNLVENIIRSQLVELVRLPYVSTAWRLTLRFRLFRRVHWRIEGTRDTSLQKI
jgi:hypothetical protein